MKNFGRIATLALIGILGAIGWQVWKHGGLPGLLESDAQAEERALRGALAQRTVRRREALIRVVDQTRDPVTQRYRTRVVWEELAADGATRHEPIEIGLAGRQPRFEALVMTFADDGRDDPLAGRSLVLFRRAYGEHTAPEAGFSFADPSRPVPPGYRIGPRPSETERGLWRRFWSLATDPAAASAEGIDVLQAKAVSTRLLPGKHYLITATDQGQLDLLGPYDAPPR